ncbi:MAG: hemin uptake protein HemP [Pelagimonas sp.]|jgi:hemin uptake protein HemP|nr:hemin uptake protein HemP [Pelagimonas sp.]
MNDFSPITEAIEILGRPMHDARQLTEGGRQAHIQLDDKIYKLCITKAGKLILTK